MDLNPQHLEKKYNSEVASVVKKAGDLLRSKYGLWFLGILFAHIVFPLLSTFMAIISW